MWGLICYKTQLLDFIITKIFFWFEAFSDLGNCGVCHPQMAVLFVLLFNPMTVTYQWVYFCRARIKYIQIFICHYYHHSFVVCAFLCVYWISKDMTHGRQQPTTIFSPEIPRMHCIPCNFPTKLLWTGNFVTNYYIKEDFDPDVICCSQDINMMMKSTSAHPPLDKMAAILPDDVFKCIFLNAHCRISI